MCSCASRADTGNVQLARVDGCCCTLSVMLCMLTCHVVDAMLLSVGTAASVEALSLLHIEVMIDSVSG